MRIGVDVGSTFVKVYIEHAGVEDFAIVPVGSFRSSVGDMRALHPACVHVVGAGFARAMERFPRLRDALPWVVAQGSSPIDADLMAQARGAQHLLRGDGARKQSDSVVVVGIGSGVSYAAVGPHGVHPAQYGRPEGGAALLRVAYGIGMEEVERIPAFPPDAEGDCTAGTADLYLQDLIPALRGSPIGAFVASHFGACDAQTPFDVRWRSAMDALAVGIVKDLLDSRSLTTAIAQATGSEDGTRTLVAVGGTVEKFPAFAARLRVWCTMAGWECIIPPHAAYAGAIGAALTVGEYDGT